MTTATSTPKKVNNVPISSPFPSSPPDSSFVPRKEFAPQPVRQSSLFALLAFSSNNAIRLSNFPQHFVTELRARLDTVIGLRSFRQNAEHKICEIILIGKPWSSPKALSTEVVLLQVFSMLFSHGFAFVSQLDYGREHSDRVSLAFSRPCPPSNLDGTISPKGDPTHQIPFGLSFCSSNTLKVVCSPLHATPAILQSIRGAWPRGVSSEKKLGENCYEFKLKGYSWFKEDTFQDDALGHMLTILTSLDKHSWKLVTSISLSSSHARNKDLWIFSGPQSTLPTDPHLRPNSPIRLGTPLKPTIEEPVMGNRREGSGDSASSHSGVLVNVQDAQHGPSAAEIAAGISRRLNKSYKEKSGHKKSASEGIAGLRKRTPLKAAIEYAVPPPSKEIASSEPPAMAPMARPDKSIRRAPSHSLISLPEAVDRGHADEDSHSEVVRDDQTLHAVAIDSSNNVTSFIPSVANDGVTPPLLAPTTFQPRSGSDGYGDSIFSDVTSQSFEVNIPIAWIPRPKDGDRSGSGDADNIPRRAPPSAFPEEVQDNRSSVLTAVTETTGPLPPGGWMRTPSLEINDPVSGNCAPRNITSHQDALAHEEPRQNTVVSHSPQIVRPGLPDEDISNRKSESGTVGMINPVHDEGAADQAVGVATGYEINRPVDEDKRKPESWVLVSVASQSGSPETPLPPNNNTESTASYSNGAEASSPKAGRHKNRSSVLGRLLTRRGFQKTKKTHGEESDKEKESEKEKNSDKEKGVRFKLNGGVSAHNSHWKAT